MIQFLIFTHVFCASLFNKQNHALAQHALAQLLHVGLGGCGVDDESAGVRWYVEAAKQHHVPSMWALALAYENGVGVPPDQTLAVNWY